MLAPFSVCDLSVIATDDSILFLHEKLAVLVSFFIFTVSYPLNALFLFKKLSWMPSNIAMLKLLCWNVRKRENPNAIKPKRFGQGIFLFILHGRRNGESLTSQRREAKISNFGENLADFASECHQPPTS